MGCQQTKSTYLGKCAQIFATVSQIFQAMSAPGSLPASTACRLVYEDVLQAFADEFRVKLKRPISSRQKDVATFRRELTDAERDIARYVGFILSGHSALRRVLTDFQVLERDKA